MDIEKERAAFEAWARDHEINLAQDSGHFNLVRAMWGAWQASTEDRLTKLANATNLSLHIAQVSTSGRQAQDLAKELAEPRTVAEPDFISPCHLVAVMDLVRKYGAEMTNKEILLKYYQAKAAEQSTVAVPNVQTRTVVRLDYNDGYTDGWNACRAEVLRMNGGL